jgi:protein CpxP
MTSFRLGLLASLVLPLGLATASFAQPAPPPAPSAPADEMRHHHHDPAQMRAHMADHLRTVLQLTSAQDPALNAFLDSMQPPAGAGMDRHHDHDQDQHLTTPQRLDKMLAHLDAQRTRMTAHVEAVKTFYAQLTPTQQAAFDDIAPMMMHHGDGDHQGQDGDHDGAHHHHDGDQPMGPGGPPQG